MRFTLSLLLLLLAGLVAFLLDIALGSVSISWGELQSILLGTSEADPQLSYIIWAMRIPGAITAAVVGAGLALSGLQMQTLFRNPLADASILGVSGGAGLGVALFMMGGTLLSSVWKLPAVLQTGGMLLFAILGAALVLLLVASIAYKSQDITRVLIIGVMISFIAGSIISLLQYFAPPEMVKGFQLWSFGSLEGSTSRSTLILCCIVLPAAIAAAFYPKALNALLLGDLYARSVGISTRRVRNILILLTGIIAGSITAFVGPIAFLGIAVPHIVRNLSRSSDHRKLMPLCLIGGATLMLVCHIITHLPQGGLILPINVVTGIIGAPIVIATVLRSKPNQLL